MTGLDRRLFEELVRRRGWLPALVEFRLEPQVSGLRGRLEVIPGVVQKPSDAGQTYHGIDPIGAIVGGLIVLLFKGVLAGIDTIWRASEVVSVYLSQPAGAAVGGAVVGALVEKVTEAVLDWARDYSYSENRQVKVKLYGPDGKLISKQKVDARPTRGRRVR